MAGEEPSDDDEDDGPPRDDGGSPGAEGPVAADGADSSGAGQSGSDDDEATVDDAGGGADGPSVDDEEERADEGTDSDEDGEAVDDASADEGAGDEAAGTEAVQGAVDVEAGGEPTSGGDEAVDGAGDPEDPADSDDGEEVADSNPETESIFDRREGPEEDREMPLTEHVEEMIRRLAVVVAVAGLVSLLVFPFADRVVNFLWYSIMPGVPTDVARPRLYGVLEKLFTEVKVASLAGLIVALPVIVYETYAFMRPGLYPNERRYYLAAVPTSLVLAIVGVSFAYFVILPAIFVYFLYYSQDVATIGFALGRTFDLILLLMGYMALVFQIPLFIMLAMMMGLVTRRWLAARRLLFWGGFLGLSFLFSPDPTGMAPIVVAATMIVLFEGTLLLTKWTGRE